jgi:hypothetical protein
MATKIMGQNFRAFVGNTPAVVTEATNCQVTISGNMEDSSTKDDVQSWTKEQMVSKQWSVSVDNVDASLASLRALITQFNSDNKIKVGWDQTAGANNAVAQIAAFACSGYAVLNDLSIQANNRSTITITAQYQGDGAIS